MADKKNIFISGVSGCVGHYIFEVLRGQENLHFYLLVRDPSKLKFDPSAFENITLIQDDLKNIKNHAAVIAQMDFVIHAAADWGGNEGNYDYTLSLFKAIDPARCQKIIYFSTASILADDGKPLPEAEEFGTHYIRSKYRIYKKLAELPIHSKVITLFPTWVLGGDREHPYSHALQGIIGMKKWLWLIRFFTVDASFHYIHARDIALMVKYLLENETKENNYILGNPVIRAGEFIRAICRFYGVKTYFQLPINLQMVTFLAWITGRKLHPWDLFSFKRRHFVYATVNPASFGLPGGLKTVDDILRTVN